MSYRNLTTNTMVAITGVWVDPSRDRPTIEAYPELGGSLTMVERAHDEVIETQQADGVSREMIDNLTEAIFEVDARHDRKARACYKLVEGLAERADDPDEQAYWRAVGEALFPDGLSVVNATYLDQAGGVDKVRSRIDAAMRAKLDATDIDGESLGETVDDWLEAGAELGELFTRRARLEAEDDGARVTAGDVRDARFFWIRAVKNFVGMLEMLDVDQKTRDQLLTPLREAKEAAGKQEGDTDDAEVPAEPSDEDVTEPV